MVVDLERGDTIEVVAPPTAGAAVVIVARGVSQSPALGAVWAEESTVGRGEGGLTVQKRLRRDSDAKTMMVSVLAATNRM